MASKGSHAPSSRSSEPGEGGRLEFAYPDGGREDKKVSLSYAASEVRGPRAWYWVTAGAHLIIKPPYVLLLIILWQVCRCVILA